MSAIRERITRNVVSQVATGNIRLQRGEYVTKEDLDKQFDHIKSLQF